MSCKYFLFTGACRIDIRPDSGYTASRMIRRRILIDEHAHLIR